MGGGGGASSLQGPSDVGFADADSDATTDSATSGSKFDIPLSQQVGRINQSDVFEELEYMLDAIDKLISTY